MAAQKKKIALVFILNLIGHYCDTIDEIKTEILLRGSGEDLNTDDINGPYKDIEPQRSINVDLVKITKDEVTTTDYPITEDADNSTTVDIDATDNNIYKLDGLDSNSDNETVVSRTIKVDLIKVAKDEVTTTDYPITEDADNSTTVDADATDNNIYKLDGLDSNSDNETVVSRTIKVDLIKVAKDEVTTTDYPITEDADNSTTVDIDATDNNIYKLDGLDSNSDNGTVVSRFINVDLIKMTKDEVTTTDYPITKDADNSTTVDIDATDNNIYKLDGLDSNSYNETVVSRFINVDLIKMTKDEVTTTDYPITEDADNSTTVDIDTDATDNNINKLDDGLDNNNDNKTVTEPSSSTTVASSSSTPAPTTMKIEDIERAGPSISNLDDDRDFSQRVPKLSDTVEPTLQDKRNFEIKPVTPSASKSSTLKTWIDDSWLRPPPGILVPLRPMALSRALAVWNDLTVEGLNVTDLVIVGYDANGVNWRSRHSLQPTTTASGQRTVAEALSKLLLKYQDVTDANTDGTMRALITAAKLVPYDSALFIVTDKGAGDIQRLPLAIKALVEKRLKVYTIWTDPKYPSEESEQQLQGLKNVSRHTEGEVLPYSLQVMDMETTTQSSMQLWDPMDSAQARRGKVQALTEEDQMDTLLVRRGGGEAISLGVPVENGVTALRIYIEGLVEHAVLYPPNDAPQIDLYNESSVMAFSPKSRTEGLSPRDVFLIFPHADERNDMLSVLPMKRTGTETPAPTVGMWHLSVRCDTCDYRLRVHARSHIHFTAQRDTRKESLKIRVVGPVASVRESVLIDEYGTELTTLPFNYQPQTIASDDQQMPIEAPPAELISDVAVPNAIKGTNVFAKIVGRDVRGEPFVRLSGPLDNQEVRTGRSAAISSPETHNELEDFGYKAYSRVHYNESTVLPFGRAVSQVMNQGGYLLTAVQIGLGTRLYGAPGENLQLHFEVTNYRETSVRFAFQAVGELKFLRDINPRAQWVESGQTVNVIVSVGITASAQPGARDFITFTAIGLETVSISTYVYVTNLSQTITDVWPPEMRHNFQGSCIGRLGDDCAQYVWSASVIARDSNSGLLRLTSSPIGLTYDSNFVAGSREEVVGIYRATCCAPRVVVTAVDANGNANSYVIDISSYLTEAGIAAVVLAVFLLIAIILLVVFLIWWCVRRRKESAELPYTSTTRTSRNIS